MNNTNETLSDSDIQLRRMVDACAEDVIKGKMNFYPEVDEDNETEHYEAYSIKYLVDSQGNLEDVIIMLAGGGPNIWLDTQAREIQGFWGSTKYTKYIYDYEYIIEYFDEQYSCLK